MATISSDNVSVGAQRSKRRRTHEDIEEMMYGFGDSWPPHPDSVKLMEEFINEYIEDITFRAMKVSELTGSLDKDCFLYVVRKDRKKFNRVHKLLSAFDEIKKVQKLEMKET